MAPLMTGYAIALLFFLGLPWSHRINPAFTTDREGTRRTSIVLAVVHLTALVLPLAVALTGVGPYTGSGIAWGAVGLMVAALLLQRWTQRLLGSCFTLALQSAVDSRSVATVLIAGSDTLRTSPRYCSGSRWG